MLTFTEDDLRELAGDEQFDRGLGLIDRVRDARELDDGQVVAVMDDGEPRETSLDVDTMESGCSCAETFCAHAVALGLWLLQMDDAPEALRPYLLGLDRETLADLLVEQAKADPGLLQLLSLMAVKASGDSIDTEAALRGIENLQLDEDLAAGDAEDYLGEAGQVVESLRQLVAAGFEDEAIPLVKRAVEVLDGSLGFLPDDIEDADECLTAATTLYARLVTGS
ncbi:hypothetical protein D5S17_12630 [Pseudonocardiaceae bacterium YIM PH 21723]|nr:hypothetical protein D5S17_12630 [Pseudonocardiaceae bacterium YIM PH 21723]